MAIDIVGDTTGEDSNVVVGIFENVVLAILGVVGGFLASIRSSAVAVVRTIENRVNHNDPNLLLPPGQVAVAVVKGVIDEGTGASEAQYSGLSPKRFDVLVDSTGDAPGWVDLLDQWRRGLIDEGTLEHGIRTGLLRNEWVGFVKALKYVPLTAGQYLSAAVRGHLDHDTAIGKAGTLGLDATDAELLYQSLGSPPAVGQSLELWNRGFITEADVDQIVLESDIKPKYLDDIKKLAIYLPPPRTVTAMLRDGSFTEEQAKRLFVQAGLSPELADAYVKNASHGKVASHKQASVGTIKSLFVDHLITRDQALAWLEKIGYEQADSDLLLTLATFEAEQKLHVQTITKIRTLFVGKHIDEATALADLTHLNVDMTQQADLLDLWKLEQQTPSKELTLAQLTAMAKANVIDQATWMARIEALGYSAADAALLAALDFPAPAT